MKKIIPIIALAIATSLLAQEQKNETKEPLIGNKIICPVKGHDFIISKKTLKFEYENKTYYFCCKNALEEFMKNPDKYKNETNSKIGNELICPVMNTRFKVNENTPYTEYKGKIFYFCCPDCLNKFKNNPEKYIKNISKTHSKDKKHTEKNHKMCK